MRYAAIARILILALTVAAFVGKSKGIVPLGFSTGA